ncbi:MAG: glutamate--tRNA ligase [Candidatus Aenigmarchaeota archaeon ex4484_52]|nr:MAG: glutamate--tRNA ligase [Candidatus Aenigmarchaeota archaeon ex4484_52]
MKDSKKKILDLENNKNSKRIFLLTLENSLKFKGTASKKAVLNTAMAKIPECRSDFKNTEKQVDLCVNYINNLSYLEQTKLAKQYNIKQEKKQQKQINEFPDLQNAEIGKVVMRFAPNPNGPMSLGHSRIALLNWHYVKKYKGKFILRFEDTDPKIKPPLKQAYDWIKQDIEYLKIKPDEIYRQSEKFDIYYNLALKLIEQGNAYVCICEKEKFRTLKNKKLECPCRNKSLLLHKQRWKMMFCKYRGGEAVLVLKTDIKHKNPAMRDFAIFRIIDTKNLNHPYLKNTTVWPLYDFASPVQDHLDGITHIIRGIDFLGREEKHKFLYDYFKWNLPQNIVAGKFLIKGVKSTSKIAELIDEGKIKSWDDPRTYSLLSLKKRGINSNAIIDFVMSNGMKKSDINVSLDILYAMNKKYVECKNRYFFVKNPIKMRILNAPKIKKIEIPLHPEDKKRENRILNFEENIFICLDDIDLLKNAKKSNNQIRLKGLFNIKIENIKEDMIIAKYSSKKIEKGIKIIHWISKNDSISINFVDEKNNKFIGLMEKNAINENGVVQFERVGFVNLIKKNKEIYAYFGHR